MKQKGFTLIELLAVIVILAIIALIATPMILGVIDSSKKGAFEATVYHVIDAAELYYTKTGSTGGAVFDFAGDVTDLQIKGEKPAGGVIRITADGKTIAALYDKDKKWCVKKEREENRVTTESYREGSCLLEAYEAYQIGDLVTIKGIPGTFHVAQASGSNVSSVKLLYDQNIAVGLFNLNESNNDYEVSTVKTTLLEKTSSWKTDIEGVGGIVFLLDITLPTKEEYTQLVQHYDASYQGALLEELSPSVPSWVASDFFTKECDNSAMQCFGFFTKTPVGQDEITIVFINGQLQSYGTGYWLYGSAIRPMVTINKENVVRG